MEPNNQSDQAIKAQGEAPTVSPFLSAGFRWYTRRYLRKHFSAVRVAGLENLDAITQSDALLCFVNHPSWWDPLLAVLVTESLLTPRQFYAPIDAEALEQYRVFKRLGFYGLPTDSPTAARPFLRITRHLLGDRNNAVWLTPSGKFQDVRTRSTFQPGLAHIMAKLDTSADRCVALLPVALEYPFWQERTPEALVCFGPPIRIAETAPATKTKEEWQQELESDLESVQTRLAELAIAQDASDFETILDGTVGVGGIYDLLRRVSSALRGKPFDAAHTK